MADGKLESGNDPASVTNLTARDDVYVDKNGKHWNIIGTGDVSRTFHARPLSDASSFYGGLNTDKDVIAADDFGMLIDSLDDYVTARNIERKSNEAKQGGWFLLLVLAALVLSDKKGRH